MKKSLIINKKFLTIIAGITLTASTAFAAPIADLQDGQTVIGYSYYDMNNKVEKDSSFYLEHAIAPKVVLGFEVNKLSSNFPDSDMFDVYVHYKLPHNVRLIAGSRNYTEGTDRFFYGIGSNVKLTPKLDGYFTVTRSAIATEWQTGVNWNLDYQTSFQVGYKSYREEDLSAISGIGIGISHKF